VKVTVLLFARPREVVGAGKLELQLDLGSTVATAFHELAVRHPGFAPMRSSLRCAVDQDYVGWETSLHDGAELALIPPTAGG
jgi:molybdopterin synthase catalytic subunit